MSDTEAFDLIVVGSGSGNSIPEFLADWKIALVERDPVFGGTCLNRGCIPSKMLVLPADLAVDAAESARLGIDVRFEGADWAAIRDRIFGRIDAISQSGKRYRATGTPNLTLIEGTARFTGERVLEVEPTDGTASRTITAPHVLVAVGSRPAWPEVAGLGDVPFHTSDTIMRLEQFPARLGILGGGFIAAELGHVFAGLGSQVTVFNRSHTMLRTHDRDVSTAFTASFGARVELRLGRLPERVELRGDGIVLHDPDGTEVVVDELLVATGRVPNSDLIDAAAGGLALDEKGVIEVDEFMCTNVSGVWAVGDVANSWQLKHVANAETRVAFWNIVHAEQPDELRTIDYSAVPSAVFSHPQVASVGLTEQQALAHGVDFVVGRRDYGGTAYGWALVDDRSFVKVLVERSTGLVVGAHVIGPQAASIIQSLVTAMQFRQPAAEFAREQYWIHPALTEAVENALLEAVAQL